MHQGQRFLEQNAPNKRHNKTLHPTGYSAAVSLIPGSTLTLLAAGEFNRWAVPFTARQLLSTRYPYRRQERRVAICAPNVYRTTAPIPTVCAKICDWNAGVCHRGRFKPHIAPETCGLRDETRIFRTPWIQAARARRSR